MIDKIRLKKIIKSLKNSKLKLPILQYLKNNYPGHANLRKLSLELKSDNGNIKGSLMGDGKRYKIDTSLAALGLVTRVEVKANNDTFIHYFITQDGIDIVNMIENDPKIII